MPIVSPTPFLGLQVATPTLTATQILSTRVASPTLIAAPGANRALQIFGGSVRIAFGTTAYTTGGNDMDLIYAGAEADENNRWGYVAPAVGSAAANTIGNLSGLNNALGFGSDPTVTLVTAAANKAIVAHTETADWTLGDGTLHFELFYRVVVLA